MICYMCGHEVKYGTEFNDADNHFPDCQRALKVEFKALPGQNIVFEISKKNWSSEEN